MSWVQDWPLPVIGITVFVVLIASVEIGYRGALWLMKRGKGRKRPDSSGERGYIEARIRWSETFSGREEAEAYERLQPRLWEAVGAAGRSLGQHPEPGRDHPARLYRPGGRDAGRSIRDPRRPAPRLDPAALAAADPGAAHHPGSGPDGRGGDHDVAAVTPRFAPLDALKRAAHSLPRSSAGRYALTWVRRVSRATP